MLTRKTKSIIIFTAVSLIAFHTLYFIHFYGVDVPFWDEWSFADFAKTVDTGGPFWNNPHFLQHNEHRPFFPCLILAIDILLFSWNTIHLMYFGWALLVIAVILFYRLLRKTDSTLTWLVIAIAAFQFNTAGYEFLLWGIASTAWCLTAIAIILCIYFLNKTNQSTFAIIPAIISGIVASFSEFNGLLIWPVGMIGLIFFKNTRKFPLVTWVISMAIVISIFFTNYNFSTHKGIQVSTLFTINGISYVITYLTNGLSFSDDRLRIIVGIFIIAWIVFGPIYLKLKKVKLGRLVVWILFGFIGVLSAVITELGRLGLADSTSPRYLLMSSFSQISALVMITFVFLYLYRKTIGKTRKSILISIYSIFIIMVILSLVPSYSLGWYMGSISYYQRSEGLQCLMNSNSNYECPFLLDNPNFLAVQAKKLQALDLGPFKTKSPTIIPQDPLLENKNWKNMTGDLEGKGYVDHIGSNLTSSAQIFNFTRQSDSIMVDGWAFLDDKKLPINSIYAFVDNKVEGKFFYGLYRPDVAKAYGYGTTDYSGWQGVIWIHDLANGCHNVSVRLVHGDRFYSLSTISKICIN